MGNLVMRALAICAVKLPEEAEAKPLVAMKVKLPEIAAALRMLGRCER